MLEMQGFRNSGKLVAVDERKLDNAVTSINSYAIDIRNVLNNIDDTLQAIKSYTKCEGMTQVISEFNNYKQNFPRIVNSILSYKDDIIMIKQKFSREEDVLSSLLNEKARFVKPKK